VPVPEDPDAGLRLNRSLRERRGHLWIAKLRRLPCFNQIVKKLVDGQGVARVARWCRELNPEGDFQDITFETWRKYLTALAMRVRIESKKLNRVKVEPLAYQALMEEVKRQQEVIADESVGLPVWSVVKKAARELDAETMLKYCFVIQMERVEAMLEPEEKMNLLMPQGYKEVAVLLDIAAEIRKYELGKEWMTGRKSAADSNQRPNGTPPNEKAVEADTPFSDVDKN
jgi:hypothetical protein